MLRAQRLHGFAEVVGAYVAVRGALEAYVRSHHRRRHPQHLPLGTRRHDGAWQLESPHRRAIHSREHFATNIATAGGLLLLQKMGAGKYTVDELMKKKD